MKKRTLTLLIAAIVAAYCGVLFYLSRMPSLYAVLVYSARALFAAEGDYGQYLYGLQDMRLEPLDAPEGQRLTAQSISLVVNTKEPIVEKDNEGYNVFFTSVKKEESCSSQWKLPQKTTVQVSRVSVRI